MNCSQFCTIRNNEPTCVCKNGYSLNSDSRTCEGIFEFKFLKKINKFENFSKNWNKIKKTLIESVLITIMKKKIRVGLIR